MGTYLTRSRASARQEADMMLYRAGGPANVDRWRHRPSYGERMMARMAVPFGGSSYLAQGWRDNRAAQVRHWSGWVYVAGHKLAMMAASQQPICSRVLAAERDEKSGRYRYKHCYGDYRRKATGSLRPHEDLEPLPEDHRLVQLFADPNGSSDTAFDLWYETVMFLILTGSAYWWLPRDGWDLPGEIWVLPSHWVWPVVGDTTKSRDEMDWYEDAGLVDEYEIRPIYGGYGIYRFPAGDIIHLRWKNPLSKLDGFSPLTAGSRWVDLSEMADWSQWESLRSGPFPGGTLELPGDMDDPAQEDIDRIQDKFSNKFQGYQRTGRVIILKAGMKYTPLNITPREMDWGTSAEGIRDKVLAVLGMSKVLAGISTEVNRASADSAIYVVGRTTLNPMFSMVDQTLTKNLARRYRGGERIRVWHLDTAGEDPDFKLRQQQQDLSTGVTTINEVRDDRGLERYPHGGDDPMLPAGLMPMPFVSGEEIDMSAIVAAAQQAQQAAQQLQQAQQPPQQGPAGAAPGGAPGLPAPGMPAADGAGSVTPGAYGEPAAPEGGNPLPGEKRLDAGRIAKMFPRRKCQSGPNAGKPGVCPEAHADESASGSDKPSIATAAAIKPSTGAVPNSAGKVRALATRAGDHLGKLSVSTEADAAVDQLVSRNFGAITEKYGPARGAAIIGAGLLAGLAGAGAALGIGGAIATGGVMSGSYVGAVSAGVAALVASPAAGQLAAKYAVTPLIGAARYVSNSLKTAGKSAVNMDEVKKVAAEVWEKLAADWDAVDKSRWEKAS